MANDGPRAAAVQRDLIALVADANMEATLKGLLARPEALGIRSLDFLVVRHPERDPGVYLRAPEFLRPFRHRYAHVLAILDREGSGREELTAADMEQDLGQRLAPDWPEGRCAALVIDPELETWLWSDSPHVEAVLGWSGRATSLRSWLVDEGYLREAENKPHRPKEAVEAALRVARKPRSSALYERLARRVSLRRCGDVSFGRLCRILRAWFPEPS